MAELTRRKLSEFNSLLNLVHIFCVSFELPFSKPAASSTSSTSSNRQCQTIRIVKTKNLTNYVAQKEISPALKKCLFNSVSRSIGERERECVCVSVCVCVCVCVWLWKEERAKLDMINMFLTEPHFLKRSDDPIIFLEATRPLSRSVGPSSRPGCCRPGLTFHRKSDISNETEISWDTSARVFHSKLARSHADIPFPCGIHAWLA